MSECVERSSDRDRAREKEISMCTFDSIVIIEPEQPFHEIRERAQRTHITLHYIDSSSSSNRVHNNRFQYNLCLCVYDEQHRN